MFWNIIVTYYIVFDRLLYNSVTMKLILLGILSVIYHCDGLASGAPEAVCNDMTPQHEVDVQKSPLPYKVSVNKNEIKSGETLEINIGGNDYKGLLVQVRNGDKAVGEFIVPESDNNHRTLTCHGSINSAVTHKNPSVKRNSKLIWKAPNTTGKYTVYVTVVKNGGTFWAGIPTEVISVF